MKQYLKMADGFDFDEAAIEQRLFGGCISKEEAAYAAHAVVSHDDLVQMNQELLEALKRVVGDVRALADHSYGVHGLHQNGDLAPWNSLFSGGFFESWLLSVDDADAVIAKTEGGAA